METHSQKKLHPSIYLCKQTAQMLTVVNIPSPIKLKSNLQLSAKRFTVFVTLFFFIRTSNFLAEAEPELNVRIFFGDLRFVLKIN